MTTIAIGKSRGTHEPTGPSAGRSVAEEWRRYHVQGRHRPAPIQGRHRVGLEGGQAASELIRQLRMERAAMRSADSVETTTEQAVISGSQPPFDPQQPGSFRRMLRFMRAAAHGVKEEAAYRWEGYKGSGRGPVDVAISLGVVLVAATAAAVTVTSLHSHSTGAHNDLHPYTLPAGIPYAAAPDIQVRPPVLNAAALGAHTHDSLLPASTPAPATARLLGSNAAALAAHTRDAYRPAVTPAVRAISANPSSIAAHTRDPFLPASPVVPGERVSPPMPATDYLPPGSNPWAFSAHELRAHGVPNPTGTAIAEYDEAFMALNHLPDARKVPPGVYSLPPLAASSNHQ